MTTSRVNPMIMISLILALLLVFVTIYLSFMQPIKASKPIKIVSGEWAPFTGENLANNGIATVIVSSVLEQMGYAPNYEFIPWPLAQSRAESAQRNDQIRGIYPYIKSAEREKHFYFSEGIVNIAFGVFYHRDNNPNGANLTDHKALSNHRILALDGYEYDDEIAPYLPTKPCVLKDAVEGFDQLIDPKKTLLLTRLPILPETLNLLAHSDIAQRLTLSQLLPNIQTRQLNVQGVVSPLYVSWLKNDGNPQLQSLEEYRVIRLQNEIETEQLASKFYSECRQQTLDDGLIALANASKPAVLIEAQKVAENMILQRLPEQANAIKQAKYFGYIEHRMMFPKNNPNNLDLRDEFDAILIRLKSNKDAYNSLIRKANNAIELAQAVSLQPGKSQSLIEAFRYNDETESCLLSERYMLPHGSKAKINQWSNIFLKPNQNEQTPMVKVKLLNGPLSAKNMNFCVAAHSVRIN